MRTAVPRSAASPLAALAIAALAVAITGAMSPLVAVPGGVTRLPGTFWLMAALAVAADVRTGLRGRDRTDPASSPSVCFAVAILLIWGPAPAIAVQSIAVAAAASVQRTGLRRAAATLAGHVLAYG